MSNILKTMTLFVSHGRRHGRHTFGYPLTDYHFNTGLYVDLYGPCAPTHVFDVRLANYTWYNQFDNIFVMATPASVLLSSGFWRNVKRWLRPGGVIWSILPRDALFIRKLRRRVLLKTSDQFANEVATKTGFVVLPPPSESVDNYKYLVLQKP